MKLVFLYPNLFLFTCLIIQFNLRFTLYLVVLSPDVVCICSIIVIIEDLAGVPVIIIVDLIIVLQHCALSHTQHYQTLCVGLVFKTLFLDSHSTNSEIVITVMI